jgi:hemolysin activation/secretion protein
MRFLAKQTANLAYEDDSLKRFINSICGKLLSFLTLSIFFMNGALCAAAQPNSGTAMEGAKPPTITRQPELQAPSITVEGQDPKSSSEGGLAVVVKSFRFGGEAPVSVAELEKLVRSEAGKEFTLSQLNNVTEKITQYLRRQGYLVAFAYLPAQDIAGGVVQIDIVPGKYGKIKITSEANINQDHLRAMLFCAKPGMIISQNTLERALMLANDLSGITVRGTLTPGKETGTADLILTVADSTKISGAAYIDNWGNRSTGQVRYGTQLSINNIGGIGDTFSLGGMSTFEGLNNYNLGYSKPLGNDGAKAEVKYSHVGYTLGDSFAVLGATGRAAVTSYDITFPFIRGRSFNLYGSIGYDAKHLRDDIATFASYNPKHSGLWNFGLSGNYADPWLGGGSSVFGLTFTSGNLRFDDAGAATTDAAYANTAGSFAKTAFTYQRQQYVAKNLNFNLSFTGQLANKNLDSSEKLFLGGADGVRAFPQGEASGDEGYKLSGELRWLLPGWSKGQNNVYLNTFYDYGSTIVNKQPYSTGDNRRSLMGAGLGLMWVRTATFFIRMDYAWKIGKEQATGDTDKCGRFWIQGVKYF